MQKCKSTGISLPVEMMKKIDNERGDVSRSRYLFRLVEKAYEDGQSETEASV